MMCVPNVTVQNIPLFKCRSANVAWERLNIPVYSKVSFVAGVIIKTFGAVLTDL